MSEPFLVKVGDKEADLRKAFPFTLGDWEALELLGVEFGAQQHRMRAIVEIVALALGKANPEITRDMVKGLTIDDPAVQRTLAGMSGAEKIDAPFSASSTPLLLPTDGA